MKANLLISKKFARSVTVGLLLVLSLAIQAQGFKPMDISPVRKQIAEFLNKEKPLGTNAEKKKSELRLEMEVKREKLNKKSLGSTVEKKKSELRLEMDLKREKLHNKSLSSKTEKKQSELRLEMEMKREKLHLKKDSLMRKERIHPTLIVIPENKSKRAPAISASSTIVSKTVTVSAGGLFFALTDGERHSVNSLTVLGLIDARDFKTIRDTMPSLAVIDLSSATIAAYTGKAGTDTTGITKTYSANAIPQCAFWNPLTHRAQGYSSIVVPSSITAIGDCSFLDSQGLTSFVIPPLVTTIGKAAFQQCIKLNTINIPTSVKEIDGLAFSYTGLTSITIPSSVDIIGAGAFEHNLKLFSAKISARYIGPAAFDSCTILTSATINNTVKKIDDNAFSDTGLTSITIPSSVDSIGYGAFGHNLNLASANISSKYIGPEAFASCPVLTSATINNTVKKIDDFAFFWTGLASITIPSSVDFIGCGAFMSNLNLSSATISSKYIGPLAFDNCIYLTSAIINNTVKKIDDNAFSYTHLTSITIPSSVDSIGSAAFEHNLNLASATISSRYIGPEAFDSCTVLTSATINNTVMKIDDNAFSNTGLTSITIPSSVDSFGNAFENNLKLSSATISSKYIGSYAFIGCPVLSSVVINNTVKKIDDEAFYCTGLTSIMIPSSVDSIGNGAFGNCYNLASATISSKYIGPGAFSHCPVLTSALINNTVKKIGDYVFYNSGLTSIMIPSSVDSICNGAFGYCKNLSSATISSKYIGPFAFDSCTVMTSAIINNTVKKIDDNAFSWTGLTSITIPSSVDSIGSEVDYYYNGAFEDCYNLSSATISSKTTGSHTFAGDSTLTSVTLNGVSVIERGAFLDCSGLHSITIPSTVKAIGDYAFGSCSRLSSITIPSSVTSIGESAFESCSGLTGVLNISSSVITIGESAFGGCSGLSSVSIPSSVDSIGLLAFDGCGGSIIADAANPRYSSVDGVLFNKTKTTLIQCPLKHSFIAINNLANSFNKYSPDSIADMDSISSFIKRFVGADTLSYTIPSSVNSIGIGAFLDCFNLTSVVIPSSVTSIGIMAFSDCFILKSIYAYAKIPVDLSLSEYVFEGVNATACTLYVPRGSVSAYRAANQWKDFKNIVEMNTTTGLPTENNESISLYPNPVTDGFVVSGFDGIALLKLTDINGRIMLLKKIVNAESVSMSNLPKGMYMVKVITGDSTMERKVIKK